MGNDPKPCDPFKEDCGDEEEWESGFSNDPLNASAERYHEPDTDLCDTFFEPDLTNCFQDQVGVWWYYESVPLESRHTPPEA